MIDTIVLVLKQGMFTITDHDRFEPSTKGLYDGSYGFGGRGYLTCKQNPTPAELKHGIYKPRLTVTKRLDDGIYQIVMKIEFSAPKLVFGNNFDELEESDFNLLVSTLQQKLKEMGVLVFSQILISSPISAIHYSKNIALTDGLTPYFLLKEIQKANITQRLDFNQTDFRNEGHSLKFRTNSFEIAFYDKLKDLQKAKISEKRATERDNIIQLGLFDNLEDIRKHRPFEILRMEVRLNQRQKIRQILRKIGIEVEPTFQNLFKREIAQKVLLYHLDQIEGSYPRLLYFKPKSTKDFIAQFVIDNPKAKLKDAVMALGFYTALEEVNTREIRELLRKYSRSAWYRFFQQINSFNYPKTSLSAFEPIKNSINQFKPLKLVDFQAEMLNNDKYN